MSLRAVRAVFAQVLRPSFSLRDTHPSDSLPFLEEPAYLALSLFPSYSRMVFGSGCSKLGPHFACKGFLEALLDEMAMFVEFDNEGRSFSLCIVYKLLSY